MIALDTETTGLDFWHGARPYFVTTCSDDGEVRYWEWDVDPLTRKVDAPHEDLLEIGELLSHVGDEDDRRLVGQNLSFDAHALTALMCDHGVRLVWPWDATDDTLMASHLLSSSTAHDLTSLAMQYLRHDIEPYEKELETQVKKARDWARRNLKDWAIAKEGRPDMPSVRAQTWKVDAWLPRAIRKHAGYGPPGWDTVLSDYANADSSVTLALWVRLRDEIRRRGYWKVYRERMRLPPVVSRLKSRGVTLSVERLHAARDEYRNEAERLGDECVDIAAELGYELKLPKSGNNQSLLGFVFDVLNLPVAETTETGAPSLNKAAMDRYRLLFAKGSREERFISALLGKRKRDTAVSYMDGYERFMIRCEDATGFAVLHPDLNPTGTYTTRFSCSNPNEQNISKKEGFNLRQVFGPRPGREWWAFDGKNMELRLPAYVSGEQAFIDLFERGDSPPYFGSNHLLIAHLVWPEEFEATCRMDDGGLDGRLFKKKYADTLYDRVKRGNFAIQFDAGDLTADTAYGVPGARRLIKSRFSKQEALSMAQKRLAYERGHVETIPDRSVDPDRGYPVSCARDAYGKIISTKPFSNYVQGTIGWWMCRAMVRCQERLDEWEQDGFNAFITLTVHDELTFDFPAGRGPEPWRTNLPKARALQRLMEEGGRDLGFPTPVSMTYHADNYAEGLDL